MVKYIGGLGDSLLSNIQTRRKTAVASIGQNIGVSLHSKWLTMSQIVDVFLEDNNVTTPIPA